MSEIRARTIHFELRMLDDETSWGPYACVVSYRALPSSSHEENKNENSVSSAYDDDAGEQVAVYGPWNFSVDDEKKSFGIDVGMDSIKSGLYYLKVKVCPNASGLPKAETDFEEPKESAVATGLVLRYDYEREINEENEAEVVAELEDRDAIAAEAEAEGALAMGEEGERVISTEEEEAERARQEEAERLESQARRKEEYERRKAEQKRYEQL